MRPTERIPVNPPGVTPAKRFKGGIVAKLGLSVMSVLFPIFLGEFVFFRLVLRGPESPKNTYIDGLIRKEPNQQSSRWHTGAPFRINNAGWNSGQAEYSVDRPPGVFRIAIIGDSFVEALHVPFNKSLAEVLESQLGPTFQVYRFGISAAPLSQYLHMFRNIAAEYKPDFAVFVLIHNDFEESYALKLGQYSTAFLRLDLSHDLVRELDPVPYERPWYSWIRHSSTYRYLVDYRRINVQGIKNLVNRFRYDRQYQANIDVMGLEDRLTRNERVVDYVFREIQALAERDGIGVLAVMDGDRRSIYAGVESRPLYEKGALTLNRMVARVAKEVDFPFIDLHPLFEQDYRTNAVTFEFPRDNHWNAYGHAFVATVIRTHLQRNPGFSPAPVPDAR